MNVFPCKTKVKCHHIALHVSSKLWYIEVKYCNIGKGKLSKFTINTKMVQYSLS